MPSKQLLWDFVGRFSFFIASRAREGVNLDSFYSPLLILAEIKMTVAEKYVKTGIPEAFFVSQKNLRVRNLLWANEM